MAGDVATWAQIASSTALWNRILAALPRLGIPMPISVGRSRLLPTCRKAVTLALPATDEAFFLASDAAAYITGQVLHVNGGMIMSD